MFVHTVFAFLGVTEVILIIAVLILFFGASRIPGIGRGLGKGIREFKDATKGKETHSEKEVKNRNEPPLV
ncbi:twin-arginine translocase TatA/TatE family subunit [Adhaeribacter pallidiroseus]|uniref:Sec-independent protein translocase protein TatA n=1 Tax=Adhaeribacter pallidiroseus TaxID=2072847 RepID=A0A369QLX3_9BACT|nr:twin-arginine translocase TatA/TatE family subunit [Adhaeribacter pallidiroseus]RDC64655.1 Sec-independent protein translocase protein TatA [Adhaeribacter pallidiroseus]